MFLWQVINYCTHHVDALYLVSAIVHVYENSKICVKQPSLQPIKFTRLHSDSVRSFWSYCRHASAILLVLLSLLFFFFFVMKVSYSRPAWSCQWVGLQQISAERLSVFRRWAFDMLACVSHIDVYVCVSMCMCVCPCVCVYVCVSVCLCVCVYAFVYVSLCVAMYMCVCLFVCISVCRSVYMCVLCLCVCISVCRSVYMCVHLCVCVFVCRSVYMCVRLCVCMIVSLCVGLCICVYYAFVYVSLCVGLCICVYCRQGALFRPMWALSVQRRHWSRHMEKASFVPHVWVAYTCRTSADTFDMPECSKTFVHRWSALHKG